MASATRANAPPFPWNLSACVRDDGIAWPDLSVCPVSRGEEGDNVNGKLHTRERNSGRLIITTNIYVTVPLLMATLLVTFSNDLFAGRVTGRSAGPLESSLGVRQCVG